MTVVRCCLKFGKVFGQWEYMLSCGGFLNCETFSIYRRVPPLLLLFVNIVFTIETLQYYHFMEQVKLVTLICTWNKHDFVSTDNHWVKQKEYERVIQHNPIQLFHNFISNPIRYILLSIQWRNSQQNRTKGAHFSIYTWSVHTFNQTNDCV